MFLDFSDTYIFLIHTPFFWFTQNKCVCCCCCFACLLACLLFLFKTDLCVALRNFSWNTSHVILVFLEPYTTCEDYKEPVGKEDYLRCGKDKFIFLCYELSFWLSEAERNNTGRMALQCSASLPSSTQ